MTTIELIERYEITVVLWLIRTNSARTLRLDSAGTEQNTSIETMTIKQLFSIIKQFNCAI